MFRRVSTLSPATRAVIGRPSAKLLCTLHTKRCLSAYIVRASTDLPAIASAEAKLPLPKFIMQKFLTPEYGDSVAIMDGFKKTTLTFRQLHNAAYSFAESLRSRFGVTHGDCVGIISPNHLHYFTAFNGVALTGASSTCINPLYTEGEILHQLRATKAKAVITHSVCVEKILRVRDAMVAADSSAALEVIVLDSADDGVTLPLNTIPFSEMIQTESSDVDVSAFPPPGFDPHQTLSVPFSSGTTGVSKGVVLTHSNVVCNLLQSVPPEGKYLMKTESKPRGTLLLPLPLFHIYGLVPGMMLSLYVGAKLVLMPSFDLKIFLELIQSEKVTRAYIVPPVVLALSKHAIVDEYDLSSLECLNSAAAPLGPELQVACAERLGCLVKQAWGMTEISPLGTVTADEDITSIAALNGTSGKLVPNTEAKIVDPSTGMDLPPSQEGELLIRGPQVMKGYLNNPEATAATFSYEAAAPGGRGAEGGADMGPWLHTGDIGKFDEQGWLYITDRLKELIKYKGFQVAPAELEAVIASMPAVKDCVVIPVPDDEAGELPRAYVVKQDSPAAQALTEQEVQQYVAERVAPYKKLRGGVRFAESVPKSVSGKILRRVQIEIDRKESSLSQQ